MAKQDLQNLANAQRLRDEITNADLTLSARATMSVADAIQNVKHNGAKIMGVVSAFLITAEQIGISPNDLLGYAKNCINDAFGRRVEFKAVTDYINKEIINSHG